MSSKTKKPAVAAECEGVKVPQSPLLNDARIERINQSRYEGQEIAGALSVITPDDRVLEMGAGIGLVGAVAAKTGKAASVMSFEANPSLIPHIQALYDLNGIAPRIQVRNEVLIANPDMPKSMPFFVTPSFLGSSLIESKKRPSTAVDVPCTAYEDVRETYRPTVLLMDIEGGELDFLRHADLTGVRAVVIEFHPEAYGQKGMRECKSILERKGFRKSPEVCTRHVWTCVLDETQTKPQADSGWSKTITPIEKAVVVPASEQGFVQAAGVLYRDGSYCPEGALWRNGRALTTEPEMPSGKLAKRKGTWLWGGVLWVHFGHFLVESAARLWALDQLDEDIEGILYIPKRPRNGDSVSPYQQEFVNLMGRNVPLVSLDAPCEVERLIVPGQGFGLGSLITGTPEFRTAIARNFAKDIAPKGPDKIYISRSLLGPGKGNLIGETALEAELEKQGYTIFHPQKHDLTTQIAHYKAARHIIAAEGSALHLVGMVAQADQQIAVIVRRPTAATGQIVKHLHAFTGVEPISICALTRSWKPMGNLKSRLWKGELDMPGVQSELAKNGFIKRSTRKWPALDPSDVSQALGPKYEEVA